MNEWYIWGAVGLVIAGVVYFYLGNKAGLAALAFAALAAFSKRQKDAGYDKRVTEERLESEETKRRIDDAEITGDSSLAGRDWLRDYADKRKRDLR